MMLKDFFDRFLFRGRAARRVLAALEARIGALEQRLDLIASRLAPSEDVPGAVTGAIHNAKAELTGLIGEVVAAIEGERPIIRGLQSQMLDLRLSHPDGTHRELCGEIDELRARIEQLETEASQKPGDERNEAGA